MYWDSVFSQALAVCVRSWMWHILSRPGRLAMNDTNQVSVPLWTSFKHCSFTPFTHMLMLGFLQTDVWGTIYFCRFLPWRWTWFSHCGKSWTAFCEMICDVISLHSLHKCGNSAKQGQWSQIDKPLCFYLSKLSTEELLKMTYKVTDFQWEISEVNVESYQVSLQLSRVPSLPRRNQLLW